MSLYPNQTHFSPNFSRRELACRCGCKTPPEVAENLTKLAADLERLRSLAGVPITVTNAYRCPEHNRRIGGAPNGQHPKGNAADLVTRSLTPSQLKALAEKVPAFKNGGIGLYPSFLHVDRRAGAARW